MSVKIPLSVRGAQFFLLVPLGAFQLVATVAFSLTMSLSGKDYIAVVWAPIMSLACIVAAVRLGRGGTGWLRAALVLLAAQAAFSLLKLLAFGESASLVFLGFVAVCAGLLALPASRRHFIPVGEHA
ncbi:hypothetical protein [Dactylosporangium darangshiense]|jgi:hypothetical protein|uniref:Integral membrane protein n=1 Tax=Dactylosporangium darangshiense TaxID=579108 RepID=A0ABP8CV99_9ACTN|nr:hypothetical protein [Dactylosporangium sp.]